VEKDNTIKNMAFIKNNIGSWLGLKPSSEKEAEKQHDKKLKEMREEKKQQGSESSDEKRKMVMNGAKLQCKYMPTPGSLVVTSNQVSLHDQFWATEGDCTKLNLQFQGNCLHSQWGYNKPPCIGVIVPTKWEDVGTTLVQKQKVLIKKSTIKCGISNEAITILFDGQFETPSMLSNTEMDVCG
jgi:hypothetical protein